MRLPRLVILVFVAASAYAADPTPAPADSIATAKSDLATLRSPLAQPDMTQALPALDMKDVGTVPGAALPGASSLLSPDDDRGAGGTRKKKEGTGNWLVDAMDKGADHPRSAQGRDRDDLLRTDSDAIRGDERASTHPDSEFVVLDQSREKTHEADPAKAPYNPLDSFMSGWISAKDQEVLLPVSKGEITAADSAKARTDSVQNLELGPSSQESLVPGLDSVVLADSKQAGNPFLAELEAAPAVQVRAFTAPELPGFGPSEPSEANRGASAPAVELRPSDASRSFVPDFAQPSDDDKYFKQMKRF